MTVPARSPDNTMTTDIHAVVKTDCGQMYWISEMVFKDDNRVNEKHVSSLVYVGGTGIVDIKKNPENIHRIKIKICLMLKWT